MGNGLKGLRSSGTNRKEQRRTSELLQLRLTANYHPRPRSRYQTKAQGERSAFIPSVYRETTCGGRKTSRHPRPYRRWVCLFPSRFRPKNLTGEIQETRRRVPAFVKL
ncbi:hypothetical protein FF1_045358 [Malus domestica]